MNFSDLKKQSSLGALTEKLLKEAEKLGGAPNVENQNVFKLETDKAGNGRAVIRFLSAPPGEDIPFVKLYNHGFQHNGKWFIENCPTTLGKDCELCSRNSELWNSGFDSDKDIARTRKRKLSYYSNIYVVSNPANPELEGKVMLFRYGAKIFEKIKSAMKPEFEDDTPIEVFDFWKGANFRLRVKQVAGYPNYDDSIFESISPLLGGDDGKLEEVWKSELSLQELVSSDKFKSEEEFKKRLDYVLGNKGPSGSSAVAEQEEELATMFTKNKGEDEDIMKELVDTYSRSKDSGYEDNDDAYSYFEELANA